LLKIERLSLSKCAAQQGAGDKAADKLRFMVVPSK
jgi:hypothetical protein